MCNVHMLVGATRNLHLAQIVLLTHLIVCIAIPTNEEHDLDRDLVSQLIKRHVLHTSSTVGENTPKHGQKKTEGGRGLYSCPLSLVSMLNFYDTSSERLGEAAEYCWKHETS